MTDFVSEFRKNDVLLGKGKIAFEHNRHFHLIVAQHSERYRDSKRSEKTVLVRKLTKEILDKGGRFLRQDPKTKEWFCVSLQGAKEKVGHALRDSSGNKTKCFGQILRNAPTTSTKSAHNTSSSLSGGPKQRKSGQISAKPQGSQKTRKRPRVSSGDDNDDDEFRSDLEASVTMIPARRSQRRKILQIRSDETLSAPTFTLPPLPEEHKSLPPSITSDKELREEVRRLFSQRTVRSGGQIHHARQPKNISVECRGLSLVSHLSAIFMREGVRSADVPAEAVQLEGLHDQTSNTLSSDNITVVSNEEDNTMMDEWPPFDPVENVDNLGDFDMDPIEEEEEEEEEAGGGHHGLTRNGVWPIVTP